MKVKKVEQTFTAEFTMIEDEARALQNDIARARGVLRTDKKENPEKHKMLSKFLELLTNQIPPRWDPEAED